MSEKIIRTRHWVPPPIPVGAHDWQAWVNGDEKGAQGWGATEAEAIEDLKEQLAELEYTKEE